MHASMAAGHFDLPIHQDMVAACDMFLALQDHSDDAMLAAYIQMVEQSKASATGPAYQATPTYNPPAAPHGHYYPR